MTLATRLSIGHTPSTRSKHDPVKATLPTKPKKKKLSSRCLSQGTRIETMAFCHQLEEEWPGRLQE